MRGSSGIRILMFGRLGRLPLGLLGGLRYFPSLLILSAPAWRRVSIPGRWFRQASPSTPRTSWSRSSNLCLARSHLYFIHVYWNTTCSLDSCLCSPARRSEGGAGLNSPELRGGQKGGGIMWGHRL